MSTLKPFLYDTGALIAAERNRVAFWRAHRSFLIAGGVPLVPAPVVSQAWRDGARQVQLARLLSGCDITPLDHHLARNVGELLGRARVADPVDGVVAALAAQFGARVFTSDPDDIQHLLDHMGQAGKRARIWALS
ncbi:PIN domain-containing protein [Streptomyces sp. NK08204]|uniref:PIN domain-containing protein n=1 Tax=Streptomyces sp. NK08204 TaxID=2873260 RepID=UPI001CED7790|nr:PIN domain-containing protein [Streptomyces sp. NK08204]